MAQRILLSVVLLLAQALVFNHIGFLGYGTPMVCTYILLGWGLLIGRTTLLLWGFVLGVLQDMFAGTPGQNAVALTLVALLQPFILRLLASGDFLSDETGPAPSAAVLGWRTFMVYSLCLVFVQQLVVYALEYFSFAQPAELSLHILCGTICSWACCLVFEGVRRPSKDQ